VEEVEVEEPLIKTLLDLPVDLIMELVPSLTAPLRFPAVYDLLHIFL